jgi:hypothetical protein
VAASRRFDCRTMMQTVISWLQRRQRLLQGHIDGVYLVGQRTSPTGPLESKCVNTKSFKEMAPRIVDSRPSTRQVAFYQAYLELHQTRPSSRS